MARHQYQAALVRRTDQIDGQIRRASQWLLDEHVLARAQRAHRQVVMGGHRSDDRNRIDAVVVEHLVEVLRLADGREAPPESVEQPPGADRTSRRPPPRPTR